MPFKKSKQREKDLEDELAFDLAAAAEKLVQAGTPLGEALRVSRRDLETSP